MDWGWGLNSDFKNNMIFSQFFIVDVIDRVQSWEITSKVLARVCVCVCVCVCIICVCAHKEQLRRDFIDLSHHSNIKHWIMFNWNLLKTTIEKKNTMAISVSETLRKHWSDSKDNDINGGDVHLIMIVHDSDLLWRVALFSGRIIMKTVSPGNSAEKTWQLLQLNNPRWITMIYYVDLEHNNFWPPATGLCAFIYIVLRVLYPDEMPLRVNSQLSCCVKLCKAIWLHTTFLGTYAMRHICKLNDEMILQYYQSTVLSWNQMF